MKYNSFRWNERLQQSSILIASSHSFRDCIQRTKMYLGYGERFVILFGERLVWDSSFPKLVLFDLDGTLANLEHRQNWLHQTPKNWDAFAKGVSRDKPIMPVINMTNHLFDAGYYIIIVSGRDSGPSNAYLNESVDWLNEHGVAFDEIFMRKHRDYTPDDDLKRAWLREIRRDLGEPAFVFDDRARVCRMWVEEGVFVFDVSQGKGEF